MSQVNFGAGTTGKVERKALCVYSQLKTCSSSEAAAMIEGVLRHCTDMTVGKNYVDSHGQSEVAFAFCHLLGFQLLPRLKNLHRQKLYRPQTGQPDSFPNLQPILTRPINWALIRQQYDELVKFTPALPLGTADAEAILRRFTRTNLQHPTYQALAELGKAVKTIFLCRYLHAEELRREIQEGLNVVETWNSTNGFILYGKGGEFATNRLDEQELIMLSLHLLQLSLVYVNTLMIQRVVPGPRWQEDLTPEDLRALSPLLYAHVKPVRHVPFGHAGAAAARGGGGMMPLRTPAKEKARELAKGLRGERPDYAYLKQIFRELRAGLGITVPRTPKRLPAVPSEEELRRCYDAVWHARRTGDVVLIKTLLYTGARVGELVRMRLADVDLDRCQIRINQGKGKKDRVVPFPDPFKEALALHMDALRTKHATYLFESSWKKPYSDRGVRRLLERYATAAGMARNVSPHQLRCFLFTWLKKQGIDDALIQPYSGHASRKSLEVYSRLSIGDAQGEYNTAMERFSV